MVKTGGKKPALVAKLVNFFNGLLFKVDGC